MPKKGCRECGLMGMHKLQCSYRDLEVPELTSENKKPKLVRTTGKGKVDPNGKYLMALDPEEIERIMKELPKHMEELEKDQEDRRLQCGKYAPETGTCAVCKGTVSGVVRFHHSDVIGGPPPASYVDHWECDKCGLMYGKCPKS